LGIVRVAGILMVEFRSGTLGPRSRQTVEPSAP